MPYTVDVKYIEKTEVEQKVKFPTKFRNYMTNSNGGELMTEQLEFELYPFFDISDRKRMSRTCNHIGLETKNAREWNGFPENAIAIGSDGFGNHLILIHNGDGKLTEQVYFWNHETCDIETIANSITDFEE